ncbi:hypothetical protein FOL47_003206, partial [Perkinsus chesapeaki]
ELRKVIAKIRGKWVGKSSVSRIFKGLGLGSFIRQRGSRLTSKHEERRFAFASHWMNKSPQWWERVLITDEKMWELHPAAANRQVNRLRAKRASEILTLETDKFPAKLHCWGAMSARGVLKLRWIEGTLDGPSYVKILESVKDDEELPELFPPGVPWVFEDDSASPHVSSVAREWKEQNFESRFLVFHSATRKHQGVPVDELEWFHPPKLDDVWPIERLWAIVSNRVMKPNSCPGSNDKVAWKNLIEDAWKSIPASTFVRLVHAIPAKLAEIVRVGGERIGAQWSSRGKERACDCPTCISYDAVDAFSDSGESGSSFDSD